jgi:multiple sugar transport system substrate-binding protein
MVSPPFASLQGDTSHSFLLTSYFSLRFRGFVLNTAAMLLLACGAESHTESTTTVSFWAMGREGEVVQQLVPAFERENPGVRVRVQQFPFSAAHEKLLTAFVGEATPDIAQLGNSWIAEFAALGALEPLNRWVSGSQTIDSAAYFPGIWDTNLIGDTIFGVPWYVDTRVIFYREDILESAGFSEIPSSWAGWQRAMRAVQREAGPGHYAIFLPTNEWAQPVILGLQAGSPLLRDGDRYGAFSDSSFARAFAFYLELFRTGLAPPLGNNDIANAYQEFARGRFAMWITGPWNLGEFRRRLPAELQNRWATAALPGPSGDSSAVSLAGGSSLVLFHRSQQKSAAWRLVEFLSRPEQQLRFYQLTGDLPARTEAWRESGLGDSARTRAFWVQLHRVKPLPKVPEAELIATKVYQYAEQVIRGGGQPEAALAELDREVDRLLEKRRWVLSREEERRPEVTVR